MISTGNWIRANHLSERVKFRQPAPPAAPPDHPILASWRSQAPFGSGDWLARRLAQDGLSESGLASLADLSEENLWQAFGGSPVAERLAAIYAAAPATEAAPADYPAGSFTRLLAPLAADAARRLRAGAAAIRPSLEKAPFDPRGIDRLLWPAAGDRLDWMVSRSVVLELHLAKLTGELPGRTPQERFDLFLERLSQPERAFEFFAEYSVLARCLLETLDLWVDSSLEMLRRLAGDWSEILAGLDPAEPPGLLVQVAGGAGDVHCAGRAVQILGFESGFRLVYKPRSVEIHRRFEEFLGFIAERGGERLAAGRTVAKEGYGWLEFVPARPCENEDQLQSFYRRQGAFLAIFQTLNATDFHRENLIACGMHPIFIDLECLLTPDYGQFAQRNHDSLAHFEMQDSVMRVMLLPFFHENGREVFDPSGLGGGGGQVAVSEAPLWQGSGTDEMRLDRQRLPVGEAHNRPTLAGRAADPLLYGQALHEGYEKTYRLLWRHRAELLESGSILARLGRAEVRIVFRASQFYGTILQESFHPDLLRDALDRDRHFDRLWYGIDHSRMPEVAQRILPSERADLWLGDIPLFSALADSSDVNSAGGETLPGLLVRSGLEMARQRLENMSEQDLQRQLWFLHASLSALTIELRPDHLVGRPWVAELPPAATGRDHLLVAAAAAAARIRELALDDGRQAGWIGLAQTRSRGWWLRPLDADLYSGLPGVALFLAQAGDLLERPEDTALARRCLANLDRLLSRRQRVSAVGGYDGWGGLVYTWLYLSRLWNDESLLAKAEQALPLIGEALERDEDLDVLRGSAGGIPPLLALHRETGSALALALARRMGERMLEKALEYRESLYWRTESFPIHPLTGFSHGNAGFAWALVQLFAATGEERFRDAARRALRFEKYFFSERQKNWMDLRPVHAEVGSGDYEREAAYSVRWCHGSVGIGLSRLRMAPALGEEELRADLEAAVASLLAEGPSDNHCLCHGALGNAELLLELRGRADFPQAAARLEELEAEIPADLRRRGFHCGVPSFLETPGLLDGLAGIGYGLLRLAEPDRVPSVLLLELPARRS